jgi:hypothetical protein
MTEVEEPSTFLGAREATTAKRGKGGHSELDKGQTLSPETCSHPGSTPSSSGGKVQNSRMTLSCACNFLARGIEHTGPGEPGHLHPRDRWPQEPPPPPSSSALWRFTFSVGGRDTVCFSPHHVQTQGDRETNDFPGKCFTGQGPQNDSPASAYIALFPARSQTLASCGSHWFRAFTLNQSLGSSGDSGRFNRLASPSTAEAGICTKLDERCQDAILGYPKCAHPVWTSQM